ncbi:MAG: sulfatase family protein [Anaerolineales bacterium]
MKTQLSQGLSRRDFLKLISLTPISVFARPLSNLAAAANADAPNIIIIVFDAWSASNVSLYGYPRQTMPNLERFVENATVYHNHLSAGTFTVPGTSSLITGLYPWSHRALQLGAGIIAEHVQHNIFSALSATHSTLGYAQNQLADQLLYQTDHYLDTHIPNGSLHVQNNLVYSAPLFNKDARMAYASFEDRIFKKGVGYDASLFLGPLYRLLTLRDRLRKTAKYGDNYPRGLPDTIELFVLEDVVDGAIQILKNIQMPTLAYLHFHPPHDPYTPTREFFGKFAKGGLPPDKPIHTLSGKISKKSIHKQRGFYDEYIASWDGEVARLFTFLKESGLTQNSYVFVTSDHGEIFERGELGHWTPLLYDPVVHVPLVVSRPGQKIREDIHAFTSSVDILPTAAHLTGNPIPAWAEGKLLPGLGGVHDEGRSVFSLDAKTNSSFTPLVNFSISITRDHQRLAYYKYPKNNYEKYEFYDLNADPQELNDLYPSSLALAIEMKDELSEKIEEVNRPYRR